MNSPILTAVPAGSLITLGLFFLMQLLISLQPANVVEPRPRLTLDWVRAHEPQQPLQTADLLPKKDFVKPPIAPPRHATGANGPFTPVVPFNPQPPEHSGDVFGLVPDGPLVTVVRVQPDYPPRALVLGLQGDVVVQFDVLADGTVSNISVVESSDPVFERSALRAASRFRYKARVVDGVPQATVGVRYRFRFEMPD
jgi:periplasmic protein TonB